MFYMTKIYWVEELTQTVWNVSIKFDTWKNIENCTVLEEKLSGENHVNRESKSQDLKM